MEKPHAHKEQLLEMQKLYQEYKSATDNKFPDENIETLRIAFYEICDNYDWMDYVVEENGCEKLLNIKDEILIPAIYEKLDGCCDKVNNRKNPVFALQNGKWGLVLPDGKGSPVGNFEFDKIENCDKFFVVCKSDKFGVIDAKGKSLVPCVMDEIILRPLYITTENNGRAWYDDCMLELRKDDKIGVLTLDGQYVKPSYDKILFDEIVETDEALGAVLNGKDGCVSIDGHLIPDENFDTYTDKLIYSKGRYSHKSSYNYELEVKMEYAKGKIF